MKQEHSSEEGSIDKGAWKAVVNLALPEVSLSQQQNTADNAVILSTPTHDRTWRLRRRPKRNAGIGKDSSEPRKPGARASSSRPDQPTKTHAPLLPFCTQPTYWLRKCVASVYFGWILHFVKP